jgi:hypothetical protein
LTIYTDAVDVFQSFTNRWGLKVTIQNKTESFAAGSYDEGTWTDSGTVVGGSALFLPVRGGGTEQQLIEQGKITLTDKVLYLHSGLEINQGADIVIDSGSWVITDAGLNPFPNKKNLVYTEVYIRTMQ